MRSWQGEGQVYLLYNRNRASVISNTNIRRAVGFPTEWLVHCKACLSLQNNRRWKKANCFERDSYPTPLVRFLTYFISKVLGRSHFLVYAAYIEVSIHEVKSRDEQFHRVSALLCRIRPTRECTRWESEPVWMWWRRETPYTCQKIAFLLPISTKTENSSLSEIIFLLRLYEDDKTPFSTSEFSELSLKSSRPKYFLLEYWGLPGCFTLLIFK